MVTDMLKKGIISTSRRRMLISFLWHVCYHLLTRRRRRLANSQHIRNTHLSASVLILSWKLKGIIIIMHWLGSLHLSHTVCPPSHDPQSRFSFSMCYDNFVGDWMLFWHFYVPSKKILLCQNILPKISNVMFHLYSLINSDKKSQMLIIFHMEELQCMQLITVKSAN